ncbi:MAG TPA: glycosyltransferase family 4 protein [Chitinivibrionales bacterium]
MPGNAPVIVFINHWAKQLGGAERSLLDILEYAAPRCRAVLVTAEHGLLTEKAALLGVECRVTPCGLRPEGNERERLFRSVFRSWTGYLSFLAYCLSISRAVKTLRPDCIHANIPKSHVTLFMLSILGYRGACFFHMRELFAQGSCAYRIYTWFFPYRRGRIIAISEAVKANLSPRLQSKTTVIYNGVFIADNAKVAVDRPVRFLYLGRVVPWKGVHHLIEAFALIQKNFPFGNATLSLIGDTMYWSSDYREALRRQIGDGKLSESCFLLPHTDKPQAAFVAHDVFCNASFNEPFGRSIAEAQAAGLPVIAFKGGGVAEIVEQGKTGMLVPYGDITGFADAMSRFIDNTSMVAEMGLLGRKRALELFNREIQVPKICKEILQCPFASAYKH